MKTRTIRALLSTPGLNGRIGIPTVYEGKPGVGKSSLIAQVVADMGMQLEIVLASLREPSDFLGLPVPNKSGDGVTYVPPEWARRAKAAADRDGGAVVFFDEINTAPPSVQAALLRVLLEGVVGDLVLPPTVRFIAAMNSVEDAAGGWDLPPPLANRLCHMGWTSPTVQEWTSYISGSREESAPKALKPVDPVEWHKEHSHALGEIAGFLSSQQHYLHHQPKRSEPAASKAWPSPRSWDMAAKALAGARLEGLSAIEQEEIVTGCVGQKAGSDFAQWREKEDLPNAADFLAGKAKFKVERKRPDRSAAMVASCKAYLTGLKITKENKGLWVKGCAFMSQVGDFHVDLLAGVIGTFQVMSTVGLAPANCPELEAMYVKLMPLAIPGAV